MTTKIWRPGCGNFYVPIDYPSLTLRTSLDGSYCRRIHPPRAHTERESLFRMDLGGMGLSDSQYRQLAVATGEKENLPAWTYSDIRTRLYPAAMSRAFPERALSFNDLMELLKIMRPSPLWKIYKASFLNQLIYYKN